MIANGIYIKSRMDHLSGELSRGVQGLKKVENEDLLPAVDSPCSVGRVVLYLSEREDGWCYVQLTGDQDGIALVARSLTGDESLERVLVWDCSHESVQYSYSLFEKAKLLEQLSVQGPALEAVNFVSELREIKLQELINAKDFTERSFEWFGLLPGAGNKAGSGSIRMDFALPPKRSIWKSLLGSLAGEE